MHSWLFKNFVHRDEGGAITTMKPLHECFCPVCKKKPGVFNCDKLRSTCRIKPKPKNGMVGIHAQLIKTANPFIEDKTAVRFDTIINQSGNDILYDICSGFFTVSKPDTYLINWHVAVGGSQSAPYTKFAIQLHDDIHSAAAYPSSLGLVSSSALVTITKPNTQLALINNTNEMVRLAPVTPIANITITRIQPKEEAK